jgi:hypothetical protein
LAQLADWSSLVRARTDDFDDLLLVAPVASAGGTWSGPFRATASDGYDYFVKSLDTTPPGEGASLAVEFIVAEVGRLIGAPVCRTSLIRIPQAIAGWEPRPGMPLRAGLAHASRALERADEQGRPRLAARAQDDNRRRHVGVYALYDWCCGADAQWLYDLDHDRTLYSHDHGLYLPPAGKGGWTIPDLVASAGAPSELPDPRDGLSPMAINQVAAALDAVDRANLVSIMNRVPIFWPVADDELETLGWFLEHRAPVVAQRLRAVV